MATVQDIVSRHWINIRQFDVEKSFGCGPALAIDAAIVVHGSGWTLFSYDFERHCAVFVFVGIDVDLTRAPFAYNAQFEQATRVALVAFDELLPLTETMPDVPNLVQFFSMGHCGSTLLHNVFNRVPGVWCISEPIAFINLALNGAGQNQELVQKLACAALRLLMSFQGAAEAQCVVVKHFSQSTTQFALLHGSQPRGVGLFLYRDALGWANSLYHFVQKHGTGMVVPQEQRLALWRIMSGGVPETILDGILNLQATEVTFDAMSAAAWWRHMQQFAQAQRDSIPLIPLRYNELVQDPSETLAKLFLRLGFPVESVAGTLGVFDTHSHAGTRTARSADDLDFGPENYDRVRLVLGNERIRLDPDLLLQEQA